MEVAKRSPMALPFFYALARRFGRLARSALDPAVAALVVDCAKQLATERLLDQDVRQAVAGRP
jgi:hypothetical protein